MLDARVVLSVRVRHAGTPDDPLRPSRRTWRVIALATESTSGGIVARLKLALTIALPRQRAPQPRLVLAIRVITSSPIRSCARRMARDESDRRRGRSPVLAPGPISPVVRGLVEAGPAATRFSGDNAAVDSASEFAACSFSVGRLAWGPTARRRRAHRLRSPDAVHRCGCFAVPMAQRRPSLDVIRRV